MIQPLLKFNRVFALAGTLFLFSGCAGRIKPWDLQDVYTVDVQILNTRQWSKTIGHDMDDLEPIMKKEIRHYLDTDLRIYKRLEPNYAKMKSSISTVDSLTKVLIKTVRKMKRSKSAGLDSFNSKTDMTYRKMIKKLSVKIQKAQKEYYERKEKLNKGFRKVKKQIIYIEEQSVPLKKKLYAIRYKRDLVQPHIDYFNKVLNESLFQDPESAYSKNITEIAKTLEKYRIELDQYEEFLSKINVAARKEAGAFVILTSKKDGPMKYETKYEEGLENYLEILNEIRKLTESI